MINIFFSCFLYLITCCLYLNVHADVRYDVIDIGTHSWAFDINNDGQILGRDNGHYFLRDPDGTFHVIPSIFSGDTIAWTILTDKGTVYGTNEIIYDPEGHVISAPSPALYMWEKDSGIIHLGSLPARNITAINDEGQVLISRTSAFPSIWHNGVLTKLDSQDRFCWANDINNHGDVIGVSIVYNSSLGREERRAVLWKDGQMIDLHNEVLESGESVGYSLNDNGDMLIGNTENSFYLDKSGKWIALEIPGASRFELPYIFLNNTGYVYSPEAVYDVINNRPVMNIYSYDNQNAPISPWSSNISIQKVNDKGEILANRHSFEYGEQAILLKPKISWFYWGL